MTKDKQTYKIIGAAMEVHAQLGGGFLEAIYQEAFERELLLREIPCEREKPFTVTYKGKPLAKHYRPDFICYDSVVVEIKSVRQLGTADVAQVFNYLKVTGFHRALLINFGTAQLEYRRIAMDGSYKEPQIRKEEDKGTADKERFEGLREGKRTADDGENRRFKKDSGDRKKVEERASKANWKKSSKLRDVKSNAGYVWRTTTIE